MKATEDEFVKSCVASPRPEVDGDIFLATIAYVMLEYRTARLGNVISLVVLHRLLAKASPRHGSSDLLRGS